MDPIPNGAAPVRTLVTSRTLSEVFLEAPPGNNEETVPLTPFMIHVWRQNGLESEEALNRAKDREQFVYWFFDTYLQTRAPYSFAAPPNTLQWLNEPALDLAADFSAQKSVPTRKYYLTRYMLHVWKQFRHDVDISRPEGYLRFLTWFALECIPSWNLPRLLLPDDLLPVLNRPIRSHFPLTTAMRVLGEIRALPGIDGMTTAPDETVVAIAFELLPDLLQAGDPRLIPDFVSRFWSRKVSSDPESWTAFEYFATRVGRPDLALTEPTNGDHSATARDWCATVCRTAIPQADLFFSTAPSNPQNDSGSTSFNSPDKAVFIYRDHQTIAGLSKAGLLTKQALHRAGLETLDLDFSFGRTRMLEEWTHNYRRRRWARSALHILNLNPEYIPECLMCHLSTLGNSSYKIGQFYWELSDTAPIHDCGLSLVDEIWVASEYLCDVYRRRVSVPVYVMGQAIETHTPDGRFTRAAFNLPDNAYIFLFSFDAGSIVERKNPLASVQAFRKAFPTGSENVMLVLKTRNLGALQTNRDRNHWQQVTEIAAADKRICTIDQTMAPEELTGLLAICDCYISLHRSEGFGYGPADAMGLGKPVITTAYSGVMDFCNAETALLVDYTLQCVPQSAYPYMDAACTYYWAEPDIDGAARHMRRLYKEPGIGKRIGRSGQHLIRRHYSVEALYTRYVARLAELGWL